MSIEIVHKPPKTLGVDEINLELSARGIHRANFWHTATGGEMVPVDTKLCRWLFDEHEEWLRRSGRY